MTFTTTSDNASLKLNITTTSGSAKQMGCYVSPLDGAAIVAAALMRYTKGTLDFDQDGDTDLDDAIYLYNYALNGCSSRLTAARLMHFTSKYATEEKANVALNYFRDNFDELFFDESDAEAVNLLDCAIYFYNYALNGFSSRVTAARLMHFTSKYASEEKAGIALENMKELKEE